MAEPRLNILVLYNDAYTHIESTREHLRALGDHSRHQYFFLPAHETVEPPGVPGRRFSDYAEWPAAWDFSLFDAVVWHFVLPAYKTAERWPSDYIAPAVLQRLAAYDGLKVMFVQDEFTHTGQTWQSIRDAGIDLVMTVIPEPNWRLAYPEAELPGVEVISTLTGFVPEDVDRLAVYTRPMAQRTVRLAYRGRILPWRFGDLAREKYDIGVRMAQIAEARGVPVDIALTEDKRIYGEDWYRFLASARATLITESGANIFDFDGSLAQVEAETDAPDYETFAARHLAGRQEEIPQNQISPKVFEAIALRVALVGFEGGYSGVIQPGEHYIPLAKDFSNADAVLAALEDAPALEAMTARAYDSVIASGRYSYAAFVADFDGIVQARAKGPPRAEIISAPILARRRGSGAFEAIARPTPFEYALNTGVLHGAFQRRQLEAEMGRARDLEFTPRRQFGAAPPADARTVFSAGPEGMRCYDYWRQAGAEMTVDEAGAHVTTPQEAWHYAAGAPLDLSGVDFAREHAWVRLRVAGAAGEALVSLYDGGADALFQENAIPPGDGPSDVWLRAAGADANLLLLRTGARGAPAHLTVLEIEVLAAPILHPGLADLL